MWASIGQQARVPITGEPERQIITDVMNIQTGDYLDYVSEVFSKEQFQQVLHQVRRHGRGWRIVLFLDRNTPHQIVAGYRKPVPNSTNGSSVAACEK